MSQRLTHIITGLGVGGAETMLYKILSHRNTERFDVEVISLTTTGVIGERIQKLGIPVRALGIRPGFPDPRAVFRLAGWLRKSPPDVLQTWMYHADLIGGLAARLAGIRTVAWNIRQSNFDPATSKRSTILVAQSCARLSRRLPCRIVCCSEASRKVHAAMGYDATKMFVIPNGFDLRAFRPDAEARRSVRAELGLTDTTPLIGLVGRFDPQKDHRTFAQAAAHLHAARPEVHFLLCGEGLTWENAALAEWITQAGVRPVCHLMGRRQDIPRLTASFDIAASSSAYGEGFPNVVGEAMACGVVCAVTDVGDSALIVGDTGRVVPCRDPQALAEAWRDLLDREPEARQRLGTAARQRVQEHFNLPTITARYETFYQEMANSCAVSPAF